MTYSMASYVKIRYKNQILNRMRVAEVDYYV